MKQILNTFDNGYLMGLGNAFVCSSLMFIIWHYVFNKPIYMTGQLAILLAGIIFIGIFYIKINNDNNKKNRRKSNT
jgi:riboflavin transporter FmnP